MGVFKSIGKAAWGGVKNTGKVTASLAFDGVKTVGKAGLGTAELAGRGMAGYGGRVLKGAMSNPGKTALFAGGAAALGYIAADTDGRSDSGRVAMKAGLTAMAATAIPGATAVGAAAGASVLGAGMMVAGTAYSIGEMAVQVPKEPLSFSNMHDLKFTKKGKAMMLGGALVEGTVRAVDKYERIRMGQNDGMLRHQTPIIPQNNEPSYANNAGATGDLVFSMYNNR